VVRLWQEPVENYLNGGLGTLPLAPLCDVSPEDLPSVIRRMEERLDSGISNTEAGTLWVATYVLMGLRYAPILVDQLLKGVRGMKESATYQAILAEGRTEGELIGEVKGELKLLLKLGILRFGQPDATTVATLSAITSSNRIEQLGVRLLEVESWTELLADA
jgi:predicted transposase YdaD